MSRPEDASRPTPEGRRDFLKGAAVVGGAVTVAVVSGAANAAAPVAPAGDDKAGKGYHETAHVRAYYKTAAM